MTNENICECGHEKKWHHYGCQECHKIQYVDTQGNLKYKSPCKKFKPKIPPFVHKEDWKPQSPQSHHRASKSERVVPSQDKTADTQSPQSKPLKTLTAKGVPILSRKEDKTADNHSQDNLKKEKSLGVSLGTPKGIFDTEDLEKDIEELGEDVNKQREKVTQCNFCGSYRKPENLDYIEDSLKILLSQQEERQRIKAEVERVLDNFFLKRNCPACNVDRYILKKRLFGK